MHLDRSTELHQASYRTAGASLRALASRVVKQHGIGTENSELPARLVPHCEHELKFFVPMRNVVDFVNGMNGRRNDIDSILITQWYYPRRIVGEVGREIAEALDLERKGLEFYQARIRRVIEHDQARFYMQTKAKIPGEDERTSKIELSVKISSKEFASEKERADLGKLEKQRWHVSGEVSNEKGKWVQCRLELDQILRAGPRGAATPLRSAHAFWTADLEVPDRQLIATARAGLHTFKVLDGAIELSRGTEEVEPFRKALRSMRLAEMGFDRDFVDAVKGLKLRVRLAS